LVLTKDKVTHCPTAATTCTFPSISDSQLSRSRPRSNIIWHIELIMIHSKFPVSCLQIIQDFPEPPKRLNTQTNSSYLTYIHTVWQYNHSQNVHHKLQNCSVSKQQEYFIHLFTHGVLYIEAVWVNTNHK